MKRRSFLALLGALPVLGKALAAPRPEPEFDADFLAEARPGPVITRTDTLRFDVLSIPADARLVSLDMRGQLKPVQLLSARAMDRDVVIVGDEEAMQLNTGRVAHVRLMRGNDCLLTLCVHTLGGACSYVPAPGFELIGPFDVVTDDTDLEVTATYFDMAGRHADQWPPGQLTRMVHRDATSEFNRIRARQLTL